MTRSLKFKSIGLTVLRAIVVLLLGIGYFFGFSIVSILSIGLCSSEEFEVLVRQRKRNHRLPIFKGHDDAFYLQAHYVSMLGWMLLTTLLLIIGG